MSEDKWKENVQKMKDSIMEDKEIYDYLLSFIPNENEGYCWTQDHSYKKISDILDYKTGRIHSGASFSICLRCALDEIKKEIDYNLTTLS